ncbi:MAG: hypothetical protein AAB883_02535 [Patescibacteria group bacterium]|mgnify:CR=1 FL=1
MCNGSVHAFLNEDVLVGVNYQITRTDHAGHVHGVLHREGQGKNAEGKVAWAACIRRPTRVVLVDIPIELQERFGIRKVAVAIFMPGLMNGQKDCPDQVSFEDGTTVNLYEFADCGVTLALAPLAGPRAAKLDEPPQNEPIRELEDA